MRWVFVIPTVPGRESVFERAAYSLGTTIIIPHDSSQTRPGRIICAGPVYDEEGVVLKMTGYPSCGAAWNAAADIWPENAEGVMLLADDLICVTPDRDWRPEIERMLAAEQSPAVIVYNQDAVVESNGLAWARLDWPGQETPMTRIPIIRPSWWRRIPPIHYWSDNAVSHALAMQGVPIVVTHQMAFRHEWAQPGRQDMRQEERDAFEEWARNMTTGGYE